MVEKAAISQTDQSDGPLDGDHGSVVESSNHTLHLEGSLDLEQSNLEQSKEGRLLTPSDQTLGTTIQYNNLLEAEQTRAVEVCIFPATRGLMLIILNPAGYYQGI